MKWIAALVLALLLTGCGTDEPESSDDPTDIVTTTPTPKPTPSPQKTPKATPTPRPTPEPTPTVTVPPAGVDLSGEEIPQFDAAAGQITCLFDDFEGIQVRCDVLGARWRVQKPSTCQEAYGDSATLGAAPVLTCHGDTIFSPDVTRNLKPGRSVRFHNLSCTATRTSVTCHNRKGRSITVSKASYSFS